MTQKFKLNVSNRIKTFLTFTFFTLSCSSGGESFVLPRWKADSPKGTLRFIIEDKSGREFIELYLQRLLIASGDLKIEDIDTKEIGESPIPINENGYFLRLPVGEYDAKVKIRNSINDFENVVFEGAFSKNNKSQCSLETVEKGVAIIDQASCGPLRIFPNKETILKLTITDRYDDSRMGESVLIFILTLPIGIIPWQGSIRHVDFALIEPNGKLTISPVKQ